MMLRATTFYFAAVVSAVNLYVASYDGNITVLSLESGPRQAAARRQGVLTSDINSNATVEHKYELAVTTTFNTTTQSPSWLTLDKQNNVLYLVDEAVDSGNGTLLSYKTSSNGNIDLIQRRTALPGGVYATFFASGSALAVPHYSTSALQTYSVTSTGHITPLELFTYSLPHPGPIPSRQDAPHPHEVVLDPTERYLLVPDLGADLVRVYSIDAETKRLTPLAPLRAAPGSGPRHGAFSLDTISGEYVFYLGAEIAGTVTAYRVSYAADCGGMAFEELAGGVYDTLGPQHAAGELSALTAEVALSPDGRFLIASNRGDASFAVNGSLTSDSLVTFSLSVEPQDGSLEFLQLFPAGGSYPRQFALNRAGNLAAVGLQNNGTVAVLERDLATGRFVRQVALAEVGGEITCVVWDE